MSEKDLRKQIKALKEILKPFAACVYVDNGDVTISTAHMKTLDYMKADAAYHDFKGDGGALNRGKKP